MALLRPTVGFWITPKVYAPPEHEAARTDAAAHRIWGFGRKGRPDQPLVTIVPPSSVLY